ncbi:hypothetical protein [uncultured Sunxiuqinia sp.]|uniref:hypothetical protein n=1 Tax=Sunxiuqinia rutila TaxID=1397841 RepID=UPI00261B77B3|nr:hypothetical protein [uncultured Sunxiuqinia sp.]
MKKKYFLLMLVSLLVLNVFGQEKQTQLSFYNGDRLSLSLFTASKFYPEIQIESNHLEFQDARYAILLRNDIPVKELSLSWGLGYSYSDLFESYCVLPVELEKTNIFNENISLSIGLELASDLNEELRLKPLIGLSINF